MSKLDKDFTTLYPQKTSKWKSVNNICYMIYFYFTGLSDLDCCHGGKINITESFVRKIDSKYFLFGIIDEVGNMSYRTLVHFKD